MYTSPSNVSFSGSFFLVECLQKVYYRSSYGGCQKLFVNDLPLKQIFQNMKLCMRSTGSKKTLKQVKYTHIYMIKGKRLLVLRHRGGFRGRSDADASSSGIRHTHQQKGPSPFDIILRHLFSADRP